MARELGESGQTEEQRTSRSIIDREPSDLLLRACHDLRTPARAIRLHAELLMRDGAAAPDFAEWLGFLAGGARKMDLLLEALSSFAVALRTDAALFQPVAMAVALRTALANLAAALRANGAEVTHDELPRVHGNPDRLIEFLQRLIDNALKHRGDTSPLIHITAAEHAEGWRFGVRDHGAGVDEAYLQHMFNPLEHDGGPGAWGRHGAGDCEGHRGTAWWPHLGRIGGRSGHHGLLHPAHKLANGGAGEPLPVLKRLSRQDRCRSREVSG
jgi:light-regulated signal transduction histidine kinase (bacteriophytochrome)